MCGLQLLEEGRRCLYNRWNRPARVEDMGEGGEGGANALEDFISQRGRQAGITPHEGIGGPRQGHGFFYVAGTSSRQMMADRPFKADTIIVGRTLSTVLRLNSMVPEENVPKDLQWPNMSLNVTSLAWLFSSQFFATRTRAKFKHEKHLGRPRHFLKPPSLKLDLHDLSLPSAYNYPMAASGGYHSTTSDYYRNEFQGHPDTFREDA
ncbi:potassium channel subfamily K member 18-like [Tropilaelaps mercedesae]|uniref:Potassium channel subfamily K member 18-like n=1 Tax=Tropilaelaps mercedesae TaxID=418985 RepID=A0A1V9X0M8_9ACAR|nr:potassium channel subfamily K member 18-like [Tropilaelaps mercedesae]